MLNTWSICSYNSQTKKLISSSVNWLFHTHTDLCILRPFTACKFCIITYTNLPVCMLISIYFRRPLCCDLSILQLILFALALISLQWLCSHNTCLHTASDLSILVPVSPLRTYTWHLLCKPKYPTGPSNSLSTQYDASDLSILVLISPLKTLTQHLLLKTQKGNRIMRFRFQCSYRYRKSVSFSPHYDASILSILWPLHICSDLSFENLYLTPPA